MQNKSYWEHFNPDLTSLITPIDVRQYEKLLNESNFDPVKTEALVDGFSNGFDIGYRGPEVRQTEANNLKLRVGNDIELWNKVMKEVKEKRVAGGFRKPPFDNYIQSPLGKAISIGQKFFSHYLSIKFHHQPYHCCVFKRAGAKGWWTN